MAINSSNPLPPNGEQRHNQSSNTEIPLDLNSPIDTVSIQVMGLKKIKGSSLNKEFEGLKDVTNVKELLLQIEKTQENLSHLGIIKKSLSEIHCGNRKGSVIVTFHVQEMDRNFSFGAHMNGKGNMEFEADGYIPSLLGSTKSLALSYTTAPMGSTSHSNLSAAILFPRLPKNNIFDAGGLKLYKRDDSTIPYNSLSVEKSGLQAYLTDRKGTHKLVWDAALRDIHLPTHGDRLPSPSIQSLPFRSFKHSLKYQYTINCLNKLRQDAHLKEPRSGYVLNSLVETALPDGDTSYVKGEIHSFATMPIAFNSRWVLSGRFGLGTIIPYKRSNLTTIDKYQISGASGERFALRGFRQSGIGPRDTACEFNRRNNITQIANDYLGGDSFFTSEVVLSYDLPVPSKDNKSPSYQPRLFFFGNMGNIADLYSASKRNILGSLSDMCCSWRGSLGFGISLPMATGAWIEALFAFPIRHFKFDTLQKFQLGCRFSTFSSDE